MHYLLTSRLERASTIHSAGSDGDLPSIGNSNRERSLSSAVKCSVAILSWPDIMAPWYGNPREVDNDVCGAT